MVHFMIDLLLQIVNGTNEQIKNAHPNQWSERFLMLCEKAAAF